MGLTVRRLRSGDEALSRVAATVFKTSDVSITHAARFLQNPANYLIVAEMGSDLAGFALAYCLDRLDRAAAQLFVYEVAVLPRHQRQHVGTALMEFLRDLVRLERFMEAFVLTNQGNEPAISLFEKTGAKREDDASILFVYPGDAA